QEEVLQLTDRSTERLCRHPGQQPNANSGPRRRSGPRSRSRRLSGKAVRYRYSKFTGEDLDGIDLEELLSKLSDLLLSSGFDNPYGIPYDDEDGVSAEALHDAIMEALLNG